MEKLKEIGDSRPICDNCQKPFKVEKGEVLHFNNKKLTHVFCSISCSTNFFKKSVELIPIPLSELGELVHLCIECHKVATHQQTINEESFKYIEYFCPSCTTKKMKISTEKK
jgi:Zn finger protein HypA/HybF involved in hydrogenase expression